MRCELRLLFEMLEKAPAKVKPVIFLGVHRTPKPGSHPAGQSSSFRKATLVANRAIQDIQVSDVLTGSYVHSIRQPIP